MTVMSGGCRLSPFIDNNDKNNNKYCQLFFFLIRDFNLKLLYLDNYVHETKIDCLCHEIELVGIVFVCKCVNNNNCRESRKTYFYVLYF